jgi:hypothetical protein
MPFWQRLSITVVAMLAVSFVVGLIWSAITGYELPSYIAGVVGGLTALPLWDFLKRVQQRSDAV